MAFLFKNSVEKVNALAQRHNHAQSRTNTQNTQNTQLVDAVVKGDVGAVKKCLAVEKLAINALVKDKEGDPRPALVALVTECKADEKSKTEIAQLLVAAGAK